MTDTYQFPVLELHHLVDGDTYHLKVQVRPARSAFRVDLGEDTAIPEIRLLDWDTPEHQSSTRKVSAYEKYKAGQATDAAGKWLTDRIPTGLVTVTTLPDPEKYGRWLGTVTHGLNDLGSYLASLELAVPYHGTAAEPRWYQVHHGKVGA